MPAYLGTSALLLFIYGDFQKNLQTAGRCEIKEQDTGFRQLSFSEDGMLMVSIGWRICLIFLSFHGGGACNEEKIWRWTELYA